MHRCSSFAVTGNFSVDDSSKTHLEIHSFLNIKTTPCLQKKKKNTHIPFSHFIYNANGKRAHRNKHIYCISCAHLKDLNKQQKPPTMPDTAHKEYDRALILTSSALASMITMTLSHPFEVLKIGQQLAFGNYQFNLVHKQLKLYSAGLSSLNLAISTKTFLRFPIYSYLCETLESPQGKISQSHILLAGSITGFLESCWYIPFENLKSRMIGNSIGKSEREQNVSLHNSPTALQKRIAVINARPLENQKKLEYYRLHPSINLFTSFKEICVTDGLKGFFRGSTPTVLRSMSSSAVNFMFYSIAQKNYMEHPYEHTYTLTTLIGIAASSAVVMVSQPFDYIKTRTQSNRYGPFYYNGVLNCIKTGLKEEGFKAFYKGWFPRFIKVNIINFGVQLGLYHYVESLLERNFNTQKFLKP